MKKFNRVFHSIVEKAVKNPVFPLHTMLKSLWNLWKTIADKPLSDTVENFPTYHYKM